MGQMFIYPSSCQNDNYSQNRQSVISNELNMSMNIDNINSDHLNIDSLLKAASVPNINQLLPTSTDSNYSQCPALQHTITRTDLNCHSNKDPHEFVRNCSLQSNFSSNKLEAFISHMNHQRNLLQCASKPATRVSPSSYSGLLQSSVTPKSCEPQVSSALQTTSLVSQSKRLSSLQFSPSTSNYKRPRLINSCIANPQKNSIESAMYQLQRQWSDVNSISATKLPSQSAIFPNKPLNKQAISVINSAISPSMHQPTLLHPHPHTQLLTEHVNIGHIMKDSSIHTGISYHTQTSSPISNNSAVLKDGTHEPAYHPQVEAISPAPEDVRYSASYMKLQNEREEINSQLKNLTEDINKQESFLKKLIERETSLLRMIAKIAGDSITADATPLVSYDVAINNQTSNQYENPVQAIICNNQARAQLQHSSFARICGLFIEPDSLSLPLYSQPSDLAELCGMHIRFCNGFKSRLVQYLKKRKMASAARLRLFSFQYTSFSKIHNKKIEKLIQNAKRKHKDMRNKEIFEKIFPEIKKIRDDREKFNLSENSIADDSNALEIAASFDLIAEVNKIRDYAIDPPVLSAYWEHGYEFICNVGLIFDPRGQHTKAQDLSSWTQEEKHIFRDRFLITPKNFCSIASYLERKSVPECILYYYRSKKKELFKSYVKKNARRRRQDKSTSQSQHERNYPGKFLKADEEAVEIEDGDKKRLYNNYRYKNSSSNARLSSRESPVSSPKDRLNALLNSKHEGHSKSYYKLTISEEIPQTVNNESDVSVLISKSDSSVISGSESSSPFASKNIDNFKYAEIVNRKVTRARDAKPLLATSNRFTLSAQSLLQQKQSIQMESSIISENSLHNRMPPPRILPNLALPTKSLLHPQKLNTDNIELCGLKHNLQVSVDTPEEIKLPEVDASSKIDVSLKTIPSNRNLKVDSNIPCQSISEGICTNDIAILFNSGRSNSVVFDRMSHSSNTCTNLNHSMTEHDNLKYSQGDNLISSVSKSGESRSTTFALLNELRQQFSIKTEHKLDEGICPRMDYQPQYASSHLDSSAILIENFYTAQQIDLKQNISTSPYLMNSSSSNSNLPCSCISHHQDHVKKSTKPTCSIQLCHEKVFCDSSNSSNLKHSMRLKNLFSNQGITASVEENNFYKIAHYSPLFPNPPDNYQDLTSSANKTLCNELTEDLTKTKQNFMTIKPAHISKSNQKYSKLDIPKTKIEARYFENDEKQTPTCFSTITGTKSTKPQYKNNLLSDKVSEIDLTKDSSCNCDDVKDVACMKHGEISPIISKNIDDIEPDFASVSYIKYRRRGYTDSQVNLRCQLPYVHRKPYIDDIAENKKSRSPDSLIEVKNDSFSSFPYAVTPSSVLPSDQVSMETASACSPRLQQMLPPTNPLDERRMNSEDITEHKPKLKLATASEIIEDCIKNQLNVLNEQSQIAQIQSIEIHRTPFAQILPELELHEESYQNGDQNFSNKANRAIKRNLKTIISQNVSPIKSPRLNNSQPKFFDSTHLILSQNEPTKTPSLIVMNSTPEDSPPSHLKIDLQIDDETCVINSE